MQHIIMGFFWQGEETKTYFYEFKGKISIEDNGTFQGYILDEFGGAIIKGQIQGTSLEFTKKYYSESKGGSKNTIVYKLHTQIHNDAKKIFFNGWKGGYIILSGHKEDCGEAACMIFPCS